MSTETKEEVKIARKIKQLEKKIRHDSGYLSDDPDGSGARAVAKMEEELSQLQLLSQLAQLTRENEVLRKVCESALESMRDRKTGELHYGAKRKVFEDLCSALAMGKEK